ncbi:helix-turn-helix domain containing protein [Streptomyces sp. HNM0574]|uniref:helix-turn-helix domain containing protein n=1 Tax=Streptomyces sp. HNM0574 TaxID=2714954 RepID=UPI00146F2AED|nr:helix-turn-helix domain containing protein [Streptomyces sp. HNM0574]NLU67549.1 helix-turn-helix domain-containing protein [Streptomyces sp. HNM0574]
MYDLATRRKALALLAQGHSLNSASRRCGVSRAALASWRSRPLPSRPADCPRCDGTPRLPEDVPAYAYLLGLYLGDGCISSGPRTSALRIACANDYPGLIEQCERAVRAVRPGNRVCRVQQPGYVAVTAYSCHWTCLFPQHGPGPKHERRIALEAWQQAIVDEYPWEFVRGLIHSDGCRITNWTVRTVAGERKRYEYPRYFFTNNSEDIVGLCGAALDRAGVEWKLTRRARGAYNLSVARRSSVALMDAHVGAKF